MTLIELLIVVVVISVLFSIAVPSYRQYVLRSHRVEAKAALLNLAAAQEKFYLQNNTYAGDDLLAVAPPAGLGLSEATEPAWYSITIDEADAEGFSATAAATALDGQDRDAHCASFSIDHLGGRTATNDDCWR
jgi:type IV pilus assembly protein PilE